jgi:hypothetical protein
VFGNGLGRESFDGICHSVFIAKFFQSPLQVPIKTLPLERRSFQTPEKKYLARGSAACPSSDALSLALVRGLA